MVSRGLINLLSQNAEGMMSIEIGKGFAHFGGGGVNWIWGTQADHMIPSEAGGLETEEGVSCCK